MKNLFICLIVILFGFQYLTAQWESCNKGLFNREIRCLASTGNTIIAGTFGDGIFISSDNGDNWEHKYPKLSSPDVYIFDPFINCIAVFDKYLLVGNHDGVIISSDNGNIWDLKNVCTQFTDVTSLTVKANSSITDFEIFAGTVNYGVLYSSNQGISWSSKNNGMPFVSYITNIVFKEHLIYLIDDITILVSIDNGETWKETSFNMEHYKTYPMSLAVSGNDLITGSFEQGVFVSQDDGDKWISMNNGLPLPNTILQLYTGDNYTLLSSDYGVFISTDKCKSWTKRQFGLDTSSYLSTFVANDKYIFAGTRNGVFRVRKSEITSIFERSDLENTLISISPNHASDFIEISVGTRHAEPLQNEIRIYNVFGQNCDLTPTLPASREGVRISVSGLAPGMYFVRIGDKTSKFIKL